MKFLLCLAFFMASVTAFKLNKREWFHREDSALKSLSRHQQQWFQSKLKQNRDTLKIEQYGIWNQTAFTWSNASFTITPAYQKFLNHVNLNFQEAINREMKGLTDATSKLLKHNGDAFDWATLIKNNQNLYNNYTRIMSDRNVNRHVNDLNNGQKKFNSIFTDIQKDSMVMGVKPGSNCELLASYYFAYAEVSILLGLNGNSSLVGNVLSIIPRQ